MPNAAISLSATGTVLAAPGTGKRWRITSYMIQFDDADGTNTVTLKSGSTAISGALVKSCAPPLPADGLILGENEAFGLTLSGSFAVAGHVTYAKIG